MNQYPGFVPMMVPQPYMVAMPTAIPMSGSVGHGLPALPQALHPHLAAAHMAGAPVVTSSVVTAPGMASAVRAAHLPQGQLPQGVGQLPQGVGQLPQGMGQLPQGIGQLPQGMGQLPQGVAGQLAAQAGMGQLAGQQLGFPGVPGMQNPVAIPTAKVVPQVGGQSEGSPDSRKRPFSADQNKGPHGRFGNRWETNPEEEVDELNLDESLCVLDHFNSDLNLVIDPDGCGATVLGNPNGFNFTWAGARATYGVCKGKVYFELHILENLKTNFGPDHEETDPNVVRIGWSIDSSSFQLGEEPWSFGYGGTGKFSTNYRFSDYGQRFSAGDVVGAMLDLDARPASISFTKNGIWLGVAIPLHGFPVGSKDMALYPHILSKNCRVKVNFGQMDPWFPPPQGFNYIGQLPLTERVRGMRCPDRKADCEMIMIVGLPGVGKTTWGINMQKSHPEKRYNIIGTDTLIDKMRVMGLPRKRNYHGRWEVLIEKASKCLNKLFQVASRRRRNYILDQTNVYATARRRKMKFFNGFFRVAAVLQPEDAEMERRSHKRTVEDGKIVPESAVMEMKANFVLPEEHENLFDRIDFIELPKEKVLPLVEQYVREGREKRSPRETVFRNSRFGGKPEGQNSGYGQQGNPVSRSPQSQSPFGSQQRSLMGAVPSGGGGHQSPSGVGGSKQPPSLMGQGQGQQIKSEPWYGEGAGLLGQAPDMMDEPPNKRPKMDRAGGGGGMGGSHIQLGGALDLLKQQYEEAEQQQESGSGSGLQWGGQEFVSVKEEPRWGPHHQDPSAMLGAGLTLQGTPLPPHLAHQQAAAAAAATLVVSPPPGALSLAGHPHGHPHAPHPHPHAHLGAQPPPPPPPVLQGQLAHTASGPAFVALAPLPPPGPPPPPNAMLSMGGAGGPPGLGAVSSPFHPHLQQGLEGLGGGHPGLQALSPPSSAWGQQQESSTSTTTSTPSRFAMSGSNDPSSSTSSSAVGQRDWGLPKGGDDRQLQQGGWGQSPQPQQQQRPQQQGWQGQDRNNRDTPKSWQGGMDSNNSWQQQSQGPPGDRGRSSYDQNRGGKFGGDSRSSGSYDSQGYGGGDSGGRRFDDFSRPPPDLRGDSSGRSDDFDSRGGGSGGPGRGYGGQSYSDSNNDRWSSSSQQKSNSDRWSSSSQDRSDSRQDSRQDRSGQQDSRHDRGSMLSSGDGRWSGSGGGGRSDSRDRWSGGGRSDGRGQSDRWSSRSQDSSRDRGSDRDRGRDRDRDRDRDRGRDRDQDRDSYRDRDRDRSSRDQDQDGSEPRQRRRKSKWDNPEDEGDGKSGGDSGFQPSMIKKEPDDFLGPHQPSSSGSSSSFQSNQQQYYSRPGQYQSSDNGNNDEPLRNPPPAGGGFPPRGSGMNFSKPPPLSSSSGPGSSSSGGGGGFPPSGMGGPGPGGFGNKDRAAELPSLMDMRFGNRPPPPPASAAAAAGGKDPKEDAPQVPPPQQQAKPGGGGGGGLGGETSLLGPVPSVPPPKFGGGLGVGGSAGGGGGGGGVGGSGNGGGPNQPADSALPGGNLQQPPPGGPRDGGGPPPPPFGTGGPRGPPGINRPPFPPGGPPGGPPPRFSGPNAPDGGGMGMGGGGQRPNFRMDGPPRGPMRPRNPQNFGGPPGSMGGPPPPHNAPWNQNRFGGGGGGGPGGRGMPPRPPRFDGPGGPGGGRFPGGPGPMRWPRGPPR